MSSKINQLQLLQHNLQNLLGQKQQFQSQLIELDSALTELQSTEKAYKIVGKIMLAASKEDLIKDLTEKKEVAELRIKNLTQQEERLQQEFSTIQQDVVKEMQQEKQQDKKSKK